MISDTSNVPQWVIETQNTLGKTLTKPKLSSKLLLRPPLRFIFDIIIEVMEQFGFLTDCITVSELHPSVKMV
jgi:hypothetical protein